MSNSISQSVTIECSGTVSDQEQIYVLGPDSHGGTRDQTWFYLGSASYLIQSDQPELDTPDIVIQVVGIADTDGKEPYVLLLG